MIFLLCSYIVDFSNLFFCFFIFSYMCCTYSRVVHFLYIVSLNFYTWFSVLVIFVLILFLLFFIFLLPWFFYQWYFFLLWCFYLTEYYTTWKYQTNKWKRKADGIFIPLEEIQLLQLKGGTFSRRKFSCSGILLCFDFWYRF